MKKLNDIKIVLLILAVALVLVIVKSNGKNRFKHDAQNAIETAISGNFSVSADELKGNENQYLIVELNDSGETRFDNSLQIPFEKLLDELNFKKLKEIENRILLVSDDISKAEKALIILNQLGLKNLFILSTEENPEVLKFEFQPNPVVGMESVSE